MSALDTISVRVEASSGNVRPLLHEIRHALQRVADGGIGTTIDLGSLPLAPGEEKRIEELLGSGELRAELDALGPTVLQETRYAGVWFVTHRNTEQEVVARFIEVTRVPELLLAQEVDMQRAVHELEKQLEVN
ncbi:MAG: hydrogenase expression/formation protein [Gammaproteobacteria bacterium]|nr:hydrogenase expression/formation protein [Gammaproteobacteria bacterium]MDH4314148.1 hydrogenase expression/formation protein [Gammaproteobacteria bacterium]MDH5212788.1 hydrogenase expression/formation protein [Gammaproteobacteria bacterium]